MFVEEVESYLDSVTTSSWYVTNCKLDVIQREVNNHPVSTLVLTSSGRPKHPEDVAPGLRNLHNDRYHSFTSDGLLLYDYRIVIPDVMKAEMIEYTMDTWELINMGCHRT